MAHVSEEKKKIVQEYVDLINKYNIIGAVNMEGLPAPQLQNMKSQLRDSVLIKMSKRRLLKIALDQSSKENIVELKNYLQGMPALLFTNENPFKLFKKLKKNKSNAPAKAGQTAPNDIEVKAGPTSFAPGPIISELGSVGIKCGVENGKIAIKEDGIVAKRGDVISGKLAEILTRLGIEPMEVGLDLVATYENGVIFNKDVLDVDEDEFMTKLQNAGRWAFNLSIEVAYPTKDNVEMLFGKAFKDSKGLAMEANIMADAVAEELLSKAERQMLSLKDTANIEVGPAKEVAEAKQEEPKSEDKAQKEEVAEAKQEEVAEAKQEEVAKTEEVTEAKQEEVAKTEEAPEQKEEVTEAKQEEPKSEDKAQEEAVAKAEEASEQDPEVKAAEEKVEEDKKQLEKDMQKEIDNAPTQEEKEALEESKEEIEKEIKEEEQSVPSAHDLLKEKNKKEQMKNLDS